MTLDQLLAELQTMKAQRPNEGGRQVILADNEPNSTTFVKEVYFAVGGKVALATRTEYADM